MTKRAARVVPVADPDEVQRELLVKTLRGPDGEVLNLFGMLAHHPELLRRFNALGGLFVARSRLAPRLRELVILRVAARTESEYELVQHRRLGIAAGLREDELVRVTEPLDDGWSVEDRTVLAAVDQILDTHDLDDAHWDALATRYDVSASIELVVLVGFYRMLATVLQVTGVEVEAWQRGDDRG